MKTYRVEARHNGILIASFGGFIDPTKGIAQVKKYLRRNKGFDKITIKRVQFWTSASF